MIPSVDPFELLARVPLPFLARAHLPRDLAEVTTVGEEGSPREARTTRAAVAGIELNASYHALAAG